MKSSFHACGAFLFLWLGTVAHGVEVPENLTGDDWVAAHARIAEEEFAEWKKTGKKPEDFEYYAVRGEKADLIERMLTGDRLAETGIKVESLPKAHEVTVHDSFPMEAQAGAQKWQCPTVWRRITKDRFEIWTPNEGRLFDAHGKMVSIAKVRRGDGWGREWYGAFLPDGRWITTDIDEFDKEVTAFSAKGKRLWQIKGAALIPENATDHDPSALPLIAWARSDKSGKAWIVSVGSEWGRGFVKLTPDRKWEKISSPWKECLPQQLGPRGMYLDKSCMSDDGRIRITRLEAGHGVTVGWPTYKFPEGANVMIRDGGKFGILPEAWAVFIEASCHTLNATLEERKAEHIWFFDAKGNHPRWIRGRSAGTSLVSGGLWVGLPDGDCVKVDKGFVPGSHMVFATMDKKPLIPVELHDDIGLGLFLQADQLVLGTWKPGP